MVAFWSSVALMTGAYHGRPVPAHLGLPVRWDHFERWLSLFRETAHDTYSPAGAAHVIERAERIARSLNLAVQDAARPVGAAPSLLSRRLGATRMLTAAERQSCQRSVFRRRRESTPSVAAP